MTEWKISDDNPFQIETVDTGRIIYDGSSLVDREIYYMPGWAAQATRDLVTQIISDFIERHNIGFK